MSKQEQKPSYLLFRHYTTDKASNLVEIQNPNGNSTHFKYDSETLNTTPEQEKALKKYYDSVDKNPGKYNLGTNQCTTVAIDGLKKSDNINFLDALAISPDALRNNLKDTYNNSLLNNRFYNISGISSISTIKADKL